MHLAYGSSSVYLDWYISRVNSQSNERKSDMLLGYSILVCQYHRMFSFTYISHLGRDTSVDSLVERTLLRKLGGEVLFVLFEHLLVVRGQAVNLVNVRNLESGETTKTRSV